MYRLPHRYLIAILHFFGFIQLSLLRVNMSVAIVAMTTNRTLTDVNGTVSVVPAEFEWDSKDQGVVLAAYFYGYITTQLIGGYLSPIVGAGRLFGISVLLGAVLNLMTPTVAYYGRLPLIVVRFLSGVVQGPLAPATSQFWSHWAPPKESTKLLGIAFSGSHMGTLIVMATCGIVAEEMGWSWIFYIFGTSAAVWCLVWFTFVCEDPAQDKYLSVEEFKYITDSQGKIERSNFADAPWRQMLTSIPLWAAMMSQTVHNSTFYMMLTQLPTYLNDVTDLDLQSMGLMSCIPYLALAVCLQLSGLLADTLRSKYNVDTTTVRKMFNCGSYIVQAVCLLLIPYVSSMAQVIACITITVGIGGFQTFWPNIMEVAPAYAGLTMGLSNTFATLPGMIIPVLSGFIVQNGLASEWQTVFYISAGVAMTGAVLYAIFGSGQQQPWATSDKDDTFYDNLITSADEEIQ